MKCIGRLDYWNYAYLTMRGTSERIRTVKMTLLPKKTKNNVLFIESEKIRIVEVTVCINTTAFTTITETSKIVTMTILVF